MILKRLKQHRRQVTIVSSVAVGLLIIGGYAVWGNTTWAAYHAAYGDSKGKTKTDIDAALKLPASSAKERTAKLEALAGASEASAVSCDINSAVNWQQAISGTYKKWQEECKVVQSSTTSLHSELTKVTAYIKSEHELAAIVATALAASNSKVTESGYATVLAKWKAAVTSVNGMQVSPEFSPVKTKAQKAVGDVAAAWQALVAAHAAKDEARYNKAAKALSDTYAALDGIEKESTTQFTKLGEALQSSYDAAF